jgi:hypothetical protein
VRIHRRHIVRGESLSCHSLRGALGTIGGEAKERPPMAVSPGVSSWEVALA